MHIRISVAALFIVGLAGAGAAQSPQRSVWEGVYTAQQSSRGKDQYVARCAVCHGESLGGSDTVPALSGGRFVGNWDGLSAGDLFTRIRNTMPQKNPGSLDDATVADLIAYLLMKNKFPAGEGELPRSTELLKQIGISAAPPE